MPNGGLDAEKLRLLDQWAHGLQRDERAEIAAAGRAIAMLVEEVERLHVLLWDRRLYPETDGDGAALAADGDGDGVAPSDEGAPDEAQRPELERSLLGRLRARWEGVSLDG